MQHIEESEMEVNLSRTVGAGNAPSGWRGPTDEDCNDVSNDAGSWRSVQCFICSRIYFDQSLSRCPHCNSDSLQHYKTADLNYFARQRIQESFGAGAVMQGEH